MVTHLPGFKSKLSSSGTAMFDLGDSFSPQQEPSSVTKYLRIE